MNELSDFRATKIRNRNIIIITKRKQNTKTSFPKGKENLEMSDAGVMRSFSDRSRNMYA